MRSSEPGTSRYTSPLRPLADDASESVPGYEPTEADTTPASAFAPQSHAEPEETRAGEIAATAENVEQTETDAPAEDASDLEKEMARLLGQISTTRRE